jgi:hypothetical protein
MTKPLPVYELAVSEDPQSDLEVYAIALVDKPAIEKTWFAFAENKDPWKFAAVGEDDKRVVVGPAMIPDMKIYRKDEEMGEYQVFFSADTIASIAQKFFAKGNQGNANLMHDPEQAVDGVTYFMSWIKDSSKGMVGLEGEYPDGTWFVGAKVENEEVWGKIKAGEIQGFSVEGFFKYLKPASATEEELMLQKIKELLNGTKQ